MQFDQSKITPNDIQNIYDMIDKELEFAMQKFPSFPCDPLHAIGVVNEEVGEATKDALQWTYELHKNKDSETLKKELIQTAAMCIRMICGLESGHIRPDQLR